MLLSFTMQEQHHDVYNAASRSVKLPELPNSLYEAPSRILREDLPVAGARVFVLRNFFTKEECDFFINTTEGIGFDKHSDLASEYPPEYRNNQRLIVISSELGDSVWGRLQPQLQFKDVHNITPIGYATEGLWLPSSVNPGFLFGRYKPGQYFKPHYDGMYKNFNQEVSIYTITVYLNDDYEGGAVKFMRSREDPTVLYTYTPRQGDALIFNHDVYHEGETLLSNTKYLARTCLMFQRISDLSDPSKPWEKDPTWLQMREDFAKFDDILDEKDPKKFAETYMRLQSLQLKHARSIKPELHSVLPLEIVVHIFMYMDLKTLGRSVRVCKAWHSLSIHGGIWRELYANKWGRTAVSMIEGINAIADPAIINWQDMYRIEEITSNTHAEKLICFPGEYFYAKKGAKTCRFLAAVMPESHPWDNSFSQYSLSDEGGIRYFQERGVVGTERCPLSIMMWEARELTHEGADYRAEKAIIVTNRLTWGAVRDPDFVIGSGTAAPKRLFTLKSFGFSDYDDRVPNVQPLTKPVDSSITCVTDFNASVVGDALTWQGAGDICFVDRALCIAYSRGYKSALIICEEHELNNMPAQLTITPVVNFKVAREHEKLIEIYYGDRDEDNLNKLVTVIRDIVNELGGAQQIDSRIVFNREDEVAQESFLYMRGEKLESKLKSSGFTTASTSTQDVLDGADIFGHSSLYEGSVVFVRTRKYWYEK